MKKFRLFASLTISGLLLQIASFVFIPGPHAYAYRDIIFPVIGPSSFTNDFYASRTLNGKTVRHNATDIIAKKGQRLVSAIDGTITYVNYPQPSWGWAIGITDSSGYLYEYLHLNNDSDTDGNDNEGGPMKAYAYDMKPGNRIVRGQLMGWVGDSGNANGVSHLHFEIHKRDGTVINPYNSLVHAKRISAPAIHPALPSEIVPYGPYHKSNVDVSMGNFDSDPESEFITGSGRGIPTNIRIYNDNNSRISNFNVYSSVFTGGVHVGTGDVDGDGIDEIIAGPGTGGAPHIKIYRANGTFLTNFYAYSLGMKAGVHVAAGDVDGDGNDEIITSPGPGAPPHVKIFELNGNQIGGFYAYSSKMTKGVDVTSANVTGSATDEIISSPLAGAAPHVKIFQLNSSLIDEFYAYSSGFRGGVRVSAGNVQTSTPLAEILTVPASNALQHIKMFRVDGHLIDDGIFLERWWYGYHDIAAGYDRSKSSTGINRRSSIRDGIN